MYLSRRLKYALLLVSIVLAPVVLRPQENPDSYFELREEDPDAPPADVDLKEVLEQNTRPRPLPGDPDYQENPQTDPNQTEPDSDQQRNSENNLEDQKKNQQDSEQDQHGENNESSNNQQADSTGDPAAASFAGFFRPLVHAQKNDIPEAAKNKKELYTAYTRLRLGWALDDPEAVWNWQLHGNLDFISGNYQNSPLFDALWRTRSRNRFFDLEDQAAQEKYLLRGDVHRASVAYRQDKLDLTLGRQAISWGQGRFLNPLDLITPTGPFLLDAEDLPGADSVNFRYYINDLDFLQIVATPYRRSDDLRYNKLQYEDSNVLARYKFTSGDLDSQIIAGHHFHSWVLGLEGSYTIEGAGLRIAYLGRRENHLAERHYYNKEDPPPEYIHQLVLGASYAFLGGSLRTNAEVLLNSNPLKDNTSQSNALADEQAVAAGFQKPGPGDDHFFISQGRIATRNEILWQFSVGTNITDASTIDLICLWDPVGRSAFWSPVYSYDISDSLRFSAGAQLFSLPHKEEYSNFAGAQPAAYMYLSYYF